MMKQENIRTQLMELTKMIGSLVASLQRSHPIATTSRLKEAVFIIDLF